MAEAERFFESSSGGDVGAPKTPKKHKKISMSAPPVSTPAGKTKKRRISMTPAVTTKKTLAKDPTGLTGVAEKKLFQVLIWPGDRACSRMLSRAFTGKQKNLSNLCP